MLCYPWIYQMHSLNNAFGSTILSLLNIYSEHDEILCHLKYYLSLWWYLSLDLKKRRFLLDTRSAHFRRVRSGRAGLRRVCHYFRVTSDGRKDRLINRSIRRLVIPPPQKQILWQCRSVVFIWCRSVSFIWCQLLTSCTGGYVISTWFSIVWEPKTQSCRYVECARTNRTMIVEAILQTWVPLEIWNNKESFLYRTIWKKV